MEAKELRALPIGTKLTLECKQCNTPFIVSAHKLAWKLENNIPGAGSFCSRKCSGKTTIRFIQAFGVEASHRISDAEKERFAAVWNDASLTRDEQARRLGINRTTLFSRARRLELPLRFHEAMKYRSPEWWALLEQVWKDPHITTAQAREKLGVGDKQMWYCAKKRNLGPKACSRKSVYTVERIAEATRRLSDGESPRTILAEWGLEPTSIRARWLRKITGIHVDDLSYEQWSDARKAEFKADWQNGLCRVKAMQKKFGRTAGSLRRIARIFGLGPKTFIEIVQPRRPKVYRHTISRQRDERPVSMASASVQPLAGAIAFPYLALLHEAIARGCGNIVTGFDLAKLNELRAEEGEPPVRILRAPTPARGRSAIIGRPA